MTLPITGILVLAWWVMSWMLLTPPSDTATWWQWIPMPIVLFVFSTYLMVMLNNVYALIRIYSRSVSCSYMLLMSAALLYGDLGGGILSLSFIGFLFAFFQMFQNRECPGLSWCAFTCIGLGSLVWPHLLWTFPLLLVMMFFNMQAMSWRNVSAAIIGILTPYWIALPIAFFTDGGLRLQQHLYGALAIQTYTDANSYLALWHPLHVATTLLLLFIFIISVTHFVRNSFRDKIRVRMMYDAFIAIAVSGFLLLALQPQMYDQMLRIIIVALSPLLGHYITFTRSRLSNITVILLIILLWIFSFLCLSNGAMSAWS